MDTEPIDLLGNLKPHGEVISKPVIDLPQGLNSLLNVVEKIPDESSVNNPMKVISEMQEIPHFGPTRVREMKNNDFKIDLLDPVLDGNLSNSNAIIMFYAPWCPHCTNFIPEYNEAANIISNKNINGFVGAMDCTLDENRNIAHQIGVQGYPTLKVFKDGRYLKEYDGNRSKDGIIEVLTSL